MKEIEHLIHLSDRFLSGHVSAKEFASQFEDYFIDHQDAIYKEDVNTYELLSDIHEGTAFYQPEEAIRRHEPYLLDEHRLHEVVSNQVKMLKGLVTDPRSTQTF